MAPWFIVAGGKWNIEGERTFQGSADVFTRKMEFVKNGHDQSFLGPCRFSHMGESSTENWEGNVRFQSPAVEK